MHVFLKNFARGSLGVPFFRVFWGGRGRNRFVNFVKSVSIQESGVITCKNVFGWDGTRPGFCSFETRLGISPSNEFVSGFGNLTR